MVLLWIMVKTLRSDRGSGHFDNLDWKIRHIQLLMGGVGRGRS